MGVRWRVRDGSKINIWGDNWLPRQSFFKVLSHIPLGMSHDSKVSMSIMESGPLAWNMAHINGLFCEEEASWIKGIPFSLGRTEDVLIWNAEKNGNFTMRRRGGFCFIRFFAKAEIEPKLWFGLV